jgi:hypothetical protein
MEVGADALEASRVSTGAGKTKGILKSQKSGVLSKDHRSPIASRDGSVDKSDDFNQSLALKG